MRCRLWDYSSEILDTGITEIDTIETALTVDNRIYQFTLEQGTLVGESLTIDSSFYTMDSTTITIDTTTVSIDPDSIGESILLENSADTGDNSYLLQEEFKTGDYSTDKTAQNELFEVQSRTVLDFSETNPFGDVGSPN
tara:strand:- start:33 stop:449 length:417 start_codon:yes stop_codon:yes gene_type:complete